MSENLHIELIYLLEIDVRLSISAFKDASCLVVGDGDSQTIDLCSINIFFFFSFFFFC